MLFPRKVHQLVYEEKIQGSRVNATFESFCTERVLKILIRAVQQDWKTSCQTGALRYNSSTFYLETLLVLKGIRIANSSKAARV